MRNILKTYKPQIAITAIATTIEVIGILAELSSENWQTDRWTATINIMQHLILPATLIYTIIMCILTKKEKIYEYYQTACDISIVTAVVPIIIAVIKNDETQTIISSYITSNATVTAIMLYALYLLEKRAD